MTMAEISSWLFTIFNVLRIASYLPQIYRVATDRYGASAISYSTWLMWTGANASTALYATYNVFDLPLAAINLLNAVCCLAVVLLTFHKRWMFRLSEMTSSEIKGDPLVGKDHRSAPLSGTDASLVSRAPIIGLFAAIRQWPARQGEERRIRRDIELLLQMDDRMLADIGLMRGQVSMAVRSNMIAEPRRLRARFSQARSPAIRPRIAR